MAVAAILLVPSEDRSNFSVVRMGAIGLAAIVPVIQLARNFLGATGARFLNIVIREFILPATRVRRHVNEAASKVTTK